MTDTAAAPVNETHVVEWAQLALLDRGLPVTHNNQTALASWALASDREAVARELSIIFGTAFGDDDEPIVPTEDQARVRQALVVGADATLVARTVANAGGVDFTDYVTHVIDGNLSAFDPVAIEADAEVVAARAVAAADEMPATRGDIRALTDSIASLVTILSAQVAPGGRVAPAKAPAARNPAVAKRPASKATGARKKATASTTKATPPAGPPDSID